jgi:hypothetical protein
MIDGLIFGDEEAADVLVWEDGLLMPHVADDVEEKTVSVTT